MKDKPFNAAQKKYILEHYKIFDVLKIAEEIGSTQKKITKYLINNNLQGK